MDAASADEKEVWEFLSAWSEVYGMECESSFLSSVSASIRGANSSARLPYSRSRDWQSYIGPELKPRAMDMRSIPAQTWNVSCSEGARQGRGYILSCGTLQMSIHGAQ